MIFRFRSSRTAIRLLFLTFALSNVVQYILRHYYAGMPALDFAQGAAIGVGIGSMIVAVVIFTRMKNGGGTSCGTSATD